MHFMSRLSGSAFVFLAALALPACQSPPAETNLIPPASLQADFDELYASLQAAHYDLYAHRPKAEYDALFAEMSGSLTRPLTRTDAEITFQKFMAFGRVAHSNIAFPQAAWETYRANGGKVFPLSIRYLGDRLMVASDMSGPDQRLAGLQILTLNGISARDLEERLRSNLSADNDYLARTMLEFRFIPLVWLELGPQAAFELVVADETGERRAVTVPALARDELFTESTSFELDWEERRHAILDGIGYLRPGPFYNTLPGAEDMWDNSAFTAFIDEAFSSFLEAGVPAVLIDVRSNPGGDNSFSDHMVAWFADEPFRFASNFFVRVSAQAAASNARRVTPGDTGSISARFAAAFAEAKPGDVVDFNLGDTQPREGQRFEGKVYLLIDRHSYSNTVTVAALAQDYGFARVLGEETSDLASTYGAMEQFSLSRTGIVVNFPKAHIIRPNGNAASRGVVPDIAIESPLVATGDKMLNDALAFVRTDAARP